jgi:hypothetical protein
MAGEWRFVGRYRLRAQYAGHQKFGVIVQLRCQVETLVSGPVAFARQANQDNRFLCRLRWVRLEAFNQRMLRQFFPRTRSLRPAASRFIRHFTLPRTTNRKALKSESSGMVPFDSRHPAQKSAKISRYLGNWLAPLLEHGPEDVGTGSECKG